MFAVGGDVYLAVGTAGQGDADICVWTGGGADNLFSTQENWLGGREPVAGESLSSILFNNGSAGEAVNDVGDIGVAKIVLNSSGVTTVSNVSGYKFTGVTNITTAANVHHVFNCPVECKDGVTPVLPAAENNYPEFNGGLTAFRLDNANALHWSGKITMTDTADWTVDRGTMQEQVLAGSNSMFTANSVNLNWFKINSEEGVANTAKVARIYNNPDGWRYTVGLQGNWTYRWNCVAFGIRSGAVLKVGEIATSGNNPDVFHSYAAGDYGESGVIEVGTITHGSDTYNDPSNHKKQSFPFFWFNRGYRNGNSWTHTKSGTWAIGPGGLRFTASCHTEAKYRVGGCGARLNSFADWTLAAQGRNATYSALELDGGKLVINTDHYVTGDPEIDDGATPHTVTLTGRAHGTGGLIAEGAGCVVMNYASDFTGGFVATNGVTLAVKAGCKPGAGAVTMCAGTKLFFPDAGAGTTAQMGEVSFAENTRIVFSNLSASVTAASASGLAFDNASTTVFEFTGDDVLADGIYPVIALPDMTGADLASVQIAGSAMAGKTAALYQRAGEVVLVVGNGGTLAVPTMIASGNMSDAANWLGGVVPSAETAYEGIVFDFSATNVVNDIGDIAVSDIAFKTPVATTVSSVSGYKFTAVTNMTTTANVHHVFNCPVECKDGITPNLPAGSENYASFLGGITVYKLSNARPAYWSGKFKLTASGAGEHSTDWAPLGSAYSHLRDGQYLMTPGSLFEANSVCFNWFALSSQEGMPVTAKVARIVYDAANDTTGARWHTGGSNGYMASGNWNYRWSCISHMMRSKSVLKVGEICTWTDCPELFHSYADSGMTDESGVIEVGKITHGSTKYSPGTTKDQRLPWIWLNRGWRNMGSRSHSASGTWAIGSGGLTFASDACNEARYKVGSGGEALLNSFANWSLDAHSRNPSYVALEIEDGGKLVVDTSHYVTGDPEIDNGATPHTVTVNGVIGGAGNLRIVGGGTVEFNSNCSHSGWTRVENGVAILKSGARPTAGNFSVWGNGTMVRKDSGTVTLGGGLFVGDNSTLKFTINDNTDTNKLVASYVSNTIETDDKFVNVYVDAPKGQSLRGFTPYTLITVTGNTKLTTEDLSKYKLQDKPSWASRLGIVDGNLVLWPCEPGLSLSVR